MAKLDPILEQGIIAAFNKPLGSRYFVTEAKAMESPFNCALSSTQIFSAFYQQVAIKGNCGKRNATQEENDENDGEGRPSKLAAICGSADAAIMTLSPCGRAPLVSHRDRDNVIQIFVKTLDGKTLAVHVEPTATVQMLKVIIESRQGIPSDEQRLIYAGKELPDQPAAFTLKDYGITKEATIRLVLRLRGGGCMFYYANGRIFDSKFDYDFTEITKDVDAFSRGGKPYMRPLGSKRHAIKVTGIYENDDWLGNSGHNYRTQSDGKEWPVAYHGTEEKSLGSILEKGFLLEKGQRFKYGKGIYCTPDPRTALAFGTDYTLNGKSYRLIIQTRVNPASITVVKAVGNGDGTDAEGEYWIVPDGASLRPYGFCVYEMHPTVAEDDDSNDDDDISGQSDEENKSDDDNNNDCLVTFSISRAKSAFYFWMTANRNNLKKPGMTVDQVASAATNAWMALRDKSEWEKMAAEDKQRYDAELAAYKNNKN